MDVKINRGVPAPQQPRPKEATQKSAAVPFASLLQIAAQSPDEVFAAALKDRAAPDFDQLDRYFEWRISQEK